MKYNRKKVAAVLIIPFSILFVVDVVSRALSFRYYDRMNNDHGTLYDGSVYFDTEEYTEFGVLRMKQHVMLCVLWLPMIPLIVGGVVITRKPVRRKEHQYGKCFRCGYDLRATPYRCPECGVSLWQVPDKRL